MNSTSTTECGHSACVQHFIDTGDRGCVLTPEDVEQEHREVFTIHFADDVGPVRDLADRLSLLGFSGSFVNTVIVETGKARLGTTIHAWRAWTPTSLQQAQERARTAAKFIARGRCTVAHVESCGTVFDVLVGGES